MLITIVFGFKDSYSITSKLTRKLEWKNFPKNRGAFGNLNVAGNFMGVRSERYLYRASKWTKICRSGLTVMISKTLSSFIILDLKR